MRFDGTGQITGIKRHPYLKEYAGEEWMEITLKEKQEVQEVQKVLKTQEVHKCRKF